MIDMYIIISYRLWWHFYLVVCLFHIFQSITVVYLLLANKVSDLLIPPHHHHGKTDHSVMWFPIFSTSNRLPVHHFYVSSGKTGRQRHNVLNLSVRSSVRLLPNLWTRYSANELTCLGTSGPRGRARNNQLCGSASQTSRSHRDENGLGGLASFLTGLYNNRPNNT